MLRPTGIDQPPDAGSATGAAEQDAEASAYWRGPRTEFVALDLAALPIDGKPLAALLHSTQDLGGGSLALVFSE